MLYGAVFYTSGASIAAFENTSFSLRENAVSLENSTAQGDLTAHGSYINFLTTNALTIGNNASFAVHGNTVIVQNSTTSNGFSAYGSYSAFPSAMNGSASVALLGNAVRVQNVSSSNGFDAHGNFWWPPSRSNVGGEASIAIHGNDVALQNCAVSGLCTVFGSSWSFSSPISLTGSATIAIHGNAVEMQNATAVSGLSASGSHWSSSSQALVVVSEDAAIAITSPDRLAFHGSHWAFTSSSRVTVNGSLAFYGNAVAVHSSSATSGLSAYGHYWSLPANPIAASSSALIGFINNSALVSGAQGGALATGCRVTVGSYALSSAAQLLFEANVGILTATPSVGRAEVRGAFVEITVPSSPWIGPSYLFVTENAQFVARGNVARVDGEADMLTKFRDVSVFGLAFSVSCGSSDWNCSVGMFGTSSQQSHHQRHLLLIAGNEATVSAGCGGVSTMRIAPSGVSIALENIKNVTFGRGALLSVAGNALTACASVLSDGADAVAVRWVTTGDGSSTFVGPIMDARGNTVSLTGAIGGARTVGLFFVASHSALTPFYTYCFPVIASSSLDGPDEKVLVAISRGGTPSGGTSGGSARPQRWVIWRVNASFSSSGIHKMNCAVNDYTYYSEGLPNPMFTSTVAEQHSATSSPTLMLTGSPSISSMPTSSWSAAESATLTNSAYAIISRSHSYTTHETH